MLKQLNDRKDILIKKTPVLTLTRGACVPILHVRVCKSVFVWGLRATLLLLVINPIIALGVAQPHLRHRGG